MMDVSKLPKFEKVYNKATLRWVLVPVEPPESPDKYQLSREEIRARAPTFEESARKEKWVVGFCAMGAFLSLGGMFLFGG